MTDEELEILLLLSRSTYNPLPWEGYVDITRRSDIEYAMKIANAGPEMIAEIRRLRQEVLQLLEALDAEIYK